MTMSLFANKKWEEITEEEILQANIDKYNSEAIINFYADFEEPKYTYVEYDVIFGAVSDLLQKRMGRPISAIDMCGGAGKAAFSIKGCAPDSNVCLVDLSEKMLDIARLRMQKQNVGDVRIIQDDAFGFFARADEKFDMIAFSSALHHFKDPVTLLKTAAERLNDGGVIVSLADPNTLTKSRRYQFMLFMASQPETKKKVIKNCLTLNASERKQPGADAGELSFDVAEYQTYTGIDDVRLVADLEREGFHPMMHLRYPPGGENISKLLPWARLYWAFSLVLQKPGSPPKPAEALQLQKSVQGALPFKSLLL